MAKARITPHTTLLILDTLTHSDAEYQARTEARVKEHTEIPEKEKEIPRPISYVYDITIPDIAQDA